MAEFNNCIIINLDGCRRDVLYDMMDGGRLPVLNGIFNGARFQNCHTVHPTVTFPTQASGITGCKPNRHGVLLNCWMDRFQRGRRVYNYIENPVDAMAVHGYSIPLLPLQLVSRKWKPGFADCHLSKNMETLYEASSKAGISSITGFHFFARGVTERIPPSPLDMAVFFCAHFNRNLYSAFDESLIRKTLRYYDMYGIPGITFLYFASCDGVCHQDGIEGQKWYLENILEGKLLKIRRILERNLCFDKTLFVIFSDHGHKQIEKQRSGVLKFNWMLDIISRAGGYNRINRGEPGDADDAMVSLQGGMAGIYIKDRISGKWNNLPSTGQCRELAEKIFGKAGSCLNCVAYRDTESGGYTFAPSDNPMNINLDKAVKELKDEFYCDTSPDILLYPDYSRGYHFWLCPVNSIHGNLTDEERRIPLLFAGGNIRKYEYGDEASIIDISPTISHLMGFEMAGAQGEKISFAE